MKKYLLSLLAFFILTCTKAQTLTLWGTTIAGGSATGTLYEFNTDTNRDSTLHDFVKPDGAEGSLLNVNGVLYGLANLGGVNGYGMIYSYNIATGAFSDVHDFGSGTDGAIPVIGSLIQANNGLLYGVTSSGGTNDSGTIFSYNSSTNAEAVLYSFTTISGYHPIGSLIQATDSVLYGMATNGGASGNGVIFSYKISTNTYTDVHDFAGGFYDGSFSCLGLLQVGDSLLYGMTSEGGAHGYGIIFSYNFIKGDEINKHAFGNGTDGGLPYGSFIQVNDSLLYGLTNEGGVNGEGTIFSFNILSDTEIDVHDFGSGTDGTSPENSLFMASNNLLYGTTSLGGTNAGGTIFSFNTTSNSEIVVYNFGSDTDGKHPFDNLIQVDVKYETPISDTICNGSNIQLSGEGSGSYYTWTPATGLNDTIGGNVIASPTVTTVYTVTGIISDTVISVGTETVLVNLLLPKPYIEYYGDTLFSTATNGNQWYLNDSLIQGATNQAFVPTLTTVNDLYYVIVTDSITGCSISSDTTTAGIPQITLQNYIKTLPNPFNTTVTLSISPTVTDLGNWNLQVTDVLGRPVYTRQSLTYTNEIDLSNLAGGMYFITVTDGTDRGVVPVVKE